jgi:hypothetical protein
MPGRHTIAAPPGRRPVVESEGSLLMHHFPLRDREWTKEKFRLASSTSGRYTMSPKREIKQRLEGRMRMIDLAYEEQYDEMPNMFPGERKKGTSVRDWRDLVDPSERTVNHEIGAPL